MLVRLFSGQINSGLLTPGNGEGSEDNKKLSKRAILVYEGDFMSMDGEVTVTKEHLMRLATNHNALIEHAARLSGAETPAMKDFPPLQLDHSTSAKDTVGRLVGKIEIAPYIRKDGKEVLGAYGNVLVLGEDNVEKVLDGRWTHLSVGVDFEKGTFSELTITPFPAAAEASLLKKKEENMNRLSFIEDISYEDMDIFKGYKGYEIGLVVENKQMFWRVFEDEVPTSAYGRCSGESDGIAKGKAAIDNKRLSKGDSMNEEQKAKFKKHLTSSKKMTEDDAEKHLARCSEDEEEMKKLSAEVDEEEKRLAAEEDEKAKLAAKKLQDEEKEKEEKEEKMKKMSSAKENITRLATDFRKTFEGAQLAAKKGAILTRLSKLRSDAKVTPAEIKKMDIDKLSAQPQGTIDAVLKSYEDREPVIPVGALGSVKAEEVGNLSKQVRMSRLEQETRANMSLLKGTVKAGEKRLAEGPKEVEVHIDTTPHIEQEYETLCRMMDEGKIGEVKEHLKKYMKRLSSARTADIGASSEETEKQLSALAESTNKMQTQFEELQKLAGSLVGLE